MIIVALTMSAIALVVYIVFENSHGHDYAQTMAFIVLVVSQWANAFNARSDSESIFTRLKVMNKSFYAGLALSISLQLLVFFGPLGELLHIAKVNLVHMALISTIAFVVPLATCEAHKAAMRRQNLS